MEHLQRAVASTRTFLMAQSLRMALQSRDKWTPQSSNYKRRSSFSRIRWSIALILATFSSHAGLFRGDCAAREGVELSESGTGTVGQAAGYDKIGRSAQAVAAERRR